MPPPSRPTYRPSSPCATFIASEQADGLRDLTAFIDAGTLKPVVDRVFTLTDTAAAVRHLVYGPCTG